MERLKRFPSLTFAVGFILFCVVGYACAVLITKDRFTPVYTLTDDRAASIINDNFRRALNVIIEDKGLAVAAGNGTTSKVVTLAIAQTGTDYLIFVMPAWAANASITAKTVNNFTVTYTDPGGTGSTFDWILVR